MCIENLNRQRFPVALGKNQQPTFSSKVIKSSFGLSGLGTLYWTCVVSYSFKSSWFNFQNKYTFISNILELIPKDKANGGEDCLKRHKIPSIVIIPNPCSLYMSDLQYQKRQCRRGAGIHLKVGIIWKEISIMESLGIKKEALPEEILKSLKTFSSGSGLGSCLLSCFWFRYFEMGGEEKSWGPFWPCLVCHPLYLISTSNIYIH